MRKLHGEIVEVAGTRFWGWRKGWKGHAPQEKARRRAANAVSKRARKVNRVR